MVNCDGIDRLLYRSRSGVLQSVSTSRQFQRYPAGDGNKLPARRCPVPDDGQNEHHGGCRMRRLGFTLDYIAKATGYSASSVANATACVERPLASSGKDKQIEAMIHKLVRYRPPGAGVQREKRPCEHCQWRMNKEDPVVCGICYREVFG